MIGMLLIVIQDPLPTFVVRYPSQSTHHMLIEIKQAMLKVCARRIPSSVFG
jgi:hypothetical protein